MNAATQNEWQSSRRGHDMQSSGRASASNPPANEAASSLSAHPMRIPSATPPSTTNGPTSSASPPSAPGNEGPSGSGRHRMPQVYPLYALPGQQYGAGSPMGAAAMYAGNPYLYGAGAYYGPAAMYAPPPQFAAAAGQLDSGSGRGAPFMQQPGMQGMDPSSFNPMMPPYNTGRMSGDERPPPYMAMGMPEYMDLAAHHGYFPRGGYGGRRSGAGGGRGRGGRGAYGDDRRREDWRPSSRGGRGGATRAGSNNSFHADDGTPAGQLMTRIRNGSWSGTLGDLRAEVLRVCKDQNGSRVIQQQMDIAPKADVESLFDDLSNAQKQELVVDTFGNYVVQKFLDLVGVEAQDKILCVLRGNMVSQACDQYGCRVVQKALQVVPRDERTELIAELRGQVMACIWDQNGNHVIQKCIEYAKPSEDIQFMLQDIAANIVSVSKHSYGCRVVQRVFEHCTIESLCNQFADELVQHAYSLAQDPYGNYVLQHLVEKGPYLSNGPNHHSNAINEALFAHVTELSQTKSASNALEKCLRFCTTEQRDAVADRLLEDPDQLLELGRDQFGNFVMQKIIELSSPSRQRKLIDIYLPHLSTLRRSVFGKHIATCVDKLQQQRRDVDPSQAGGPESTGSQDAADALAKDVASMKLQHATEAAK